MAVGKKKNCCGKKEIKNKIIKFLIQLKETRYNIWFWMWHTILEEGIIRYGHKNKLYKDSFFAIKNDPSYCIINKNVLSKKVFVNVLNGRCSLPSKYYSCWMNDTRNTIIKLMLLCQ